MTCQKRFSFININILYRCIHRRTGDHRNRRCRSRNWNWRSAISRIIFLCV